MTSSYNGWPASPDPAAINVQPFLSGTPISFPAGVKGGDVATVFRYLVTELHRRVEPAVPGWNWGYTYKASANSPNLLSCHSSGTAVDWSAPTHPNGGSRYGGFNDAQVAEIRRILAELGGAVEWGADFAGTYDPMHFELAVSAGELAGIAANLPATEDDTVNDADIDAIADAVMHRIRNDDVVSYNKTDAGSGKETQMKGSVTDALGTAATYAGRAAYRATEADHQTS